MSVLRFHTKLKKKLDLLQCCSRALPATRKMNAPRNLIQCHISHLNKQWRVLYFPHAANPHLSKASVKEPRNPRGSLPQVLNTVLEEYHTPSTLRYHEVEFDFGTSDKLYHWETRAEALATEMGKYVFEYTVVFVSVHSEITRSDLFAGKDEKGEDVAVEPTEAIAEQVFHSLLPQRLHLTDVRLKPTYTIAFGADRFISAVLKSFIVAFGVRVLIQGHAFEEVITDLLNVSLELRMHSDTFVFQLKDRTAPCLPHPSPNPSVIGIRYSWYHNHRRPWGTALPMSCPKCSSVRSWSQSKTGVDCSNAQARISTCRSPKCKYEFFTYPPQGPYEIVKDSKSMGWIKQMDI
ncbi:hypothetical protein EDD15DRAFT_2198186 [Pisolithus albus]|nr:hypothetical protein EDD15DRAFT_2198186 [Pisolithus albus]